MQIPAASNDVSRPLTDSDSAEIRDILAGMGVRIDSTDRRGSKRHAYPAVQPAAFFDGRALPTRDMFEEVTCYNISTGGVAFFWPERPPTRQIVIGLGTPSKMTFLTARVAHVTPQRDQGKGFLIGCVLTGRANISW